MYRLLILYTLFSEILSSIIGSVSCVHLLESFEDHECCDSDTNEVGSQCNIYRSEYQQQECCNNPPSESLWGTWANTLDNGEDVSTMQFNSDHTGIRHHFRTFWAGNGIPGVPGGQWIIGAQFEISFQVTELTQTQFHIDYNFCLDLTIPTGQSGAGFYECIEASVYYPDSIVTYTLGDNTLELNHLTFADTTDQSRTYESIASFPSPPPSPPTIPPAPEGCLCTDTCTGSVWGDYLISDGECDDGGPGAEYIDCDLGTDCTDCGPRCEPPPPPPPPPQVHYCDKFKGRYTCIHSSKPGSCLWSGRHGPCVASGIH
jgi:hypothetical protein